VEAPSPRVRREVCVIPSSVDRADAIGAVLRKRSFASNDITGEDRPLSTEFAENVRTKAKKTRPEYFISKLDEVRSKSFQRRTFKRINWR